MATETAPNLTEPKYSNVFELSVLGQVVCQNLASLSDVDLFNFQPGLLKPRRAPQSLHRLCEAELQWDMVETALVLKTRTYGGAGNPIITRVRKGDVVYGLDPTGHSPFIGGKVLCHCNNPTTDVCVSLIELWSIHEINWDKGFVDWDTRNSPKEFMLSDDVWDAVTYRISDAFSARTLLPWMYRSAHSAGRL